MEEGTLGISQPALQSMAHKRWLQICVRVPQAWSGDIDVDSVSGTVGAHGLDGGELVFATVSGPIHLEDMRARLLRLRTVSGAIAGVGIDTERLAVRTAAGQIGLREMRFDSARAFTVSGTTELMLREGCGTLELQSVSGAVSVGSGRHCLRAAAFPERAVFAGRSAAGRRKRAENLRHVGFRRFGGKKEEKGP